MLLHLEEALGASVPKFKVMRLNVGNEVLVGRLDGLVRVFIWEKTLVGRHESVLVCVT